MFWRGLGYSSNRNQGWLPLTVSMMIRLLALTWTILSLVTATGFAWLFVSVNWNNRACFDENGRCFVDGVVHHDTSFIYVWIALLAAVSALAGVVIARRAQRL